jgi:hypothetical protein
MYPMPPDERAEALSPELALVDPSLAASARQRLPDPSDVLAPRAVPVPVAAPHSDFSRIDPPDVPSWELPRRVGARRLVAVVGAVVVLASGLLLADVKVEIGKTPAAAQVRSVAPQAKVTVERPLTPMASTRPRAGTSRPTPPARSSKPKRAPRTLRPASVPSFARRFAWAPLAGAVGYHVELFRGPARVFAADTRRPTIEIPASWTHAGRKETLRAGAYRWYVWSVGPEGRAARALVQAELIVPSR